MSYAIRSGSSKYLTAAGLFVNDYRPPPPPPSPWLDNLDGVTRLPYRLPELLASDPAEIVYMPEGEKDVETLRLYGLVASCNSEGGAEKFRPGLAK